MEEKEKEGVMALTSGPIRRSLVSCQVEGQGAHLLIQLDKVLWFNSEPVFVY